MLAGSLLLGFTVILVGYWLEYNDLQGWPSESDYDVNDVNPQNIRYRVLRRRWRRVVHVMLAISGALMASAGVAGLGRFWIAAWTSVALLLMSIIVIAVGDAIRTARHHRRRLTARSNGPR